MLNYGEPDGIGGVASYWMVFLQQAGGTMYGDDGMPVFNDAPGVDALQVMIDLMPSTDPSSIANVGINDATNVLTAGTASMMMNWPFMWNAAAEPGDLADRPASSASAILPAGPAGTASIDGTDAWTIAATSPNPELSMELIEFYLGADVQKRQVLDTGWLPIRLSVLEDPEVQAAAPNAAVVLEQAQHSLREFRHPGLQRGHAGDRHGDPEGAPGRADRRGDDADLLRCRVGNRGGEVALAVLISPPQRQSLGGHCRQPVFSRKSSFASLRMTLCGASRSSS